MQDFDKCINKYFLFLMTLIYSKLGKQYKLFLITGMEVVVDLCSLWWHLGDTHTFYLRFRQSLSHGWMTFSSCLETVHNMLIILYFTIASYNAFCGFYDFIIRFYAIILFRHLPLFLTIFLLYFQILLCVCFGIPHLVPNSKSLYFWLWAVFCRFFWVSTVQISIW